MSEFLGGFAKSLGGSLQKMSDDKQRKEERDEERKANMEDFEAKESFRAKLQEASDLRRASGETIVEGGKIKYLNSQGQPLFERQASETELKTNQAKGQTLDATLEDTSPDRRKQLRGYEEEDRAVKKQQAASGMNAQSASADASRMSAANTSALMGDRSADRARAQAERNIPGGGAPKTPSGSDQTSIANAATDLAANADSPEDANFFRWAAGKATSMQEFQAAVADYMRAKQVSQ